MFALVHKSLLSRAKAEAGVPGNAPRFAMLETLREYALDKLSEHGEEDALRREHALYFMRLAEEAEPHLTSPEQVEWLNKLEVETDNLRTALRWALVKSCDGDGSESPRHSTGRRMAAPRLLRCCCAWWLLWAVSGA